MTKKVVLLTHFGSDYRHNFQIFIYFLSIFSNFVLISPIFFSFRLHHPRARALTQQDGAMASLHVSQSVLQRTKRGLLVGSVSLRDVHRGGGWPSGGSLPGQTSHSFWQQRRGGSRPEKVHLRTQFLLEEFQTDVWPRGEQYVLDGVENWHIFL